MYFVLLLSVILVWSKHSYPISLFHNSQVHCISGAYSSTSLLLCRSHHVSLNILYNDTQKFYIDHFLLQIYCTICYNVYHHLRNVKINWNWNWNYIFFMYSLEIFNFEVVLNFPDNLVEKEQSNLTSTCMR